VLTLQEAADELYSLPLDEFTPRRNDLAKELRPRDRDLAEAVRRLPKPSRAAWAVNAFSRRGREQLDALLTLGAQLREAQEDLAGETLRELSEQARPAVRQAVQAAAELAARGEVTLSESAERQVEQTLRAALADEQAARAVQTGFLTRPLKPVGFGVNVDGALAVAPSGGPSADTGRGANKRAVSREQRREERQAATAALKELEKAEKNLRQQEERSEELQDAASAATSRAQALRGELVQAERQAAEAVAAARDARRERDAARTEQRAARRRGDRAQKRLDKLS
jgi:NADH dehydrogenase/NADH:ubiquinone oxidoreductase subunit G